MRAGVNVYIYETHGYMYLIRVMRAHCTCIAQDVYVVNASTPTLASLIKPVDVLTDNKYIPNVLG